MKKKHKSKEISKIKNEGKSNLDKMVQFDRGRRGKNIERE
jgi:hypothetical protein